MRRRDLVLLCVSAVAGCKRHEDARPRPAPTFVPAPDSPLARELGADDAGRGVFRAFDDGPACGNGPRVDRKKQLGRGVTAHASSLMAAAPETPFGFFELDRVPVESAPVKQPLQLLLAGPKKVARGSMFALTLSMRNPGESPATFVRAMDGSFEHWRAPFVDLFAKDLTSGRAYRWTYGTSYGRCGNMNVRSAEDFVTIVPGQRIDAPFGSWSKVNAAMIDVPGTYALWVVYAACEGVEMRHWMAGEDAPLPRDAFEGVLVSEKVIVTIE